MTSTLNSKLASFLSALTGDNKGGTAIEYALVTSIVALLVLGAFSTFGTQLVRTFEEISAALDDEPDISATAR